MTNPITLTGLVATTPRYLTTSDGLQILSFRMASTVRKFNESTQKWVDLDTNWYTVSAFRELAENCSTSITKGDRVIVSGLLRIRDWENTDRSGTTVEVEASVIGHDLGWCTASAVRTSTPPQN